MDQLKATYPAVDRNNQPHMLEVVVTLPQPYPEEKGIEHTDYFCDVTISAADYNESFRAGGIDPLQAMYLALEHVKRVVASLKNDRGITCEYFFAM